MLLRCSCCDWTPGPIQSDYFRGLSSGAYAKKLIEDRHGDTVCDVCYSKGYQTEDDDEDDLFDPAEHMEDE